MIIYFFETNTEEQLIFEKACNQYSVFCTPKKLTEDTAYLAKDADIVSVFVHSEISSRVIDMLPKLAHITTRSTGYDHIDTVYAKKKGIQVATVPAYGSATVAEFTFGLLLCVSRHLVSAVSHTTAEECDTALYKGFDLHGKTIGVIGTGRIGRHVLQIAKGFGMHSIACDMYPDEAYAATLGFTYVPLETLLARADIITLHVPYTSQNHHMLDTAAFSKMKKGVCIINTARGELIDTAALLAALADGTVCGAGLDVLEGERSRTEAVDDAILHHPKVLVTPHIAFDSTEAASEIIKTTLENIESFIHHTPKNLV